MQLFDSISNWKKSDSASSPRLIDVDSAFFVGSTVPFILVRYSHFLHSNSEMETQIENYKGNDPLSAYITCVTSIFRFLP